MENQAAMEQQSYEDVRKSGYLRKQKSMHRRFFVLRAASEQGPARLEYYENEKKFRSKSPVPKKAVNLDSCFNINKRADSKNKYMIVLYTRGELYHSRRHRGRPKRLVPGHAGSTIGRCCSGAYDCKTPDDCGSGGDCGLPSPGPAFKEVWQVKVWPKGLGQARNLVGIYRLCLTDKTVNFVKLNSDVAAVVLQLMNVRRCGHSENFFFIEVGRSAMTGPGEFWMQVEDSVVAQNMHETLLEAMKALSEEFRQRSKSQTVGVSCGGGTASNPISVPSRRHHPNLPPSQVGFSRRARTETPGVPHSTNTSPTPRQGFSRSRTASIGARTEDGGGRATALSTSPSLNGSSCSTTPTLRPKPTRAPTPAKITLSLARYTPNPAPSPAPSLSSSSGHGSECGLSGAPFGTVPICTYARIPQRVSMSGSPSDYGSSDEYGSSPGEHSLLAAGIPAALVEGGASYILMGHREGSHKRAHGRRVFRRSSNRECEAERRLLSKRASLPPTIAQEHLVPCRQEEEDGEDYAYRKLQQIKVSCSPDIHGMSGCIWSSRGSMESRAGSDYMNMSPIKIWTGLVLVEVFICVCPNPAPSPAEINVTSSAEGARVVRPESSARRRLNYIDLDLVKEMRVYQNSRKDSKDIILCIVLKRVSCSVPPLFEGEQILRRKLQIEYLASERQYCVTQKLSRRAVDLKRVLTHTMYVRVCFLKIVHHIKCMIRKRLYRRSFPNPIPKSKLTEKKEMSINLFEILHKSTTLCDTNESVYDTYTKFLGSRHGVSFPFGHITYNFLFINRLQLG
ncbi:Insulin receptor substrate 1 [Triplophysa tibetana]|uniref:Insulin receptor substrate 1 n=1 Tax=Triplophysa tibetana TaxID=1572043 RepID=A0A5A9P7T7_9TELE|nr:Insulin receptor substrate 1 [Triplophysa tibetana]